ncbi:MAG: DUF1801 domain-containing protein [Hellea sp.]
MAKAKNKTVETELKVSDYIANIADDSRRADCQKILDMMGRVSGDDPKIWGTSLKSGIVGFGNYHYKYDSGREGDSLRTGFSSRAQNISIYIMPGYQDLGDELSRLGKHKMGKACLYIKRLSDVDETVLEEIVTKGLKIMAEKYPF